MPATLRARTLVSAIALASALLGCAPMTAQQCAQAEWYTVGLEDGRAGHAPDQFARRSNGCAARGVHADHERYSAGLAAGLQEYCTVEGGVRAGRGGYGYRDVCADEGEDDFLTGYLLGALSSAD